MAEKEREVSAPGPDKLIRVELNPNEKKLVTEKMAALQAYRQAQARLTEVNLKLMEAGIRPDLGEIMCW